MWSYVDDVVILARSRQRLVEVYKGLNQKSAGMRLYANRVLVKLIHADLYLNGKKVYIIYA